MKTTYHIFKPDGTETLGEVDWPDEPEYEQIKALIEPLLDGAWLEHVSVLFNGARADMFVDETGRLKGLPRNERASEIYAEASKRHPRYKDWAIAPIVGTAIVFDRRVWF